MPITGGALARTRKERREGSAGKATAKGDKRVNSRLKRGRCGKRSWECRWGEQEESGGAVA